MDFSAIKNRTYFLSKSSATSYPIADLTQSANNATERVVSLINRHDSKWQFDSTENTDLPIATATITSGQKDYSLETTHLTIDRVEVKDTSGNWTRLKQLDQQLLKRERSIALAEYMETTGTPTEYDVVGNSVFLYPTPNFTQASSLKLYFTRPPVAFVTTDTTKTPGFNSLFHDLIPLWCAFDYASVNDTKNAEQLFRTIQIKEQELITFYALRNRDERGRLSVSYESNR